MAKDLGKVCMVSKGAYNAETQYEVLDLVNYDGGLYCAKKDTKGNSPGDGEYWFLACKGAYMLAKDAGYTGTETEFNTAIGNVGTIIARYNSDHEQAEADHSTADADHGIAEADHSTADADHGIAESDHSTADADHQTAETDHGIADADHQTATSDHQTATSDHTQADSDHEFIREKCITYDVIEECEYDGSGDGQPVAKLRVDLTAEIAARKAADSDEATARANGDTTEKAAREAADANLQSQINGKAASSHTHTKSEITDFAHNHAEVHSFYTTLETIN